MGSRECGDRHEYYSTCSIFSLWRMHDFNHEETTLAFCKKTKDNRVLGLSVVGIAYLRGAVRVPCPLGPALVCEDTVLSFLLSVPGGVSSVCVVRTVAYLL